MKEFNKQHQKGKLLDGQATADNAIPFLELDSHLDVSIKNLIEQVEVATKIKERHEDILKEIITTSKNLKEFN